MACPDPGELEALAHGRVNDAQRGELFAHLDGCESCRSLLGALARRSPIAGDQTLAAFAATENTEPLPDGAREPAVFARGQHIGRYEVEFLLGMGGLGMVYAAKDPELGRRVALKLLQSAPDGGLAGQERMVREARALARISHPNVVAVYDVGTYADRVFIA